jgi:hypothetical protein
MIRHQARHRVTSRLADFAVIGMTVGRSIPDHILEAG